MATRTEFIDHAPTISCPSNEMVVIKNRCSFAATPMDAADVVQVLNIPAGFHVLGVSVEVETAEGGTCTATVGDATSAAAWDASINLNAAAGTVTLSTPSDTFGATGGKAYTAADTIDLVLGHATDAAIIVVCAYGYFYDWIQ